MQTNVTGIIIHYTKPCRAGHASSSYLKHFSLLIRTGHHNFDQASLTQFNFDSAKVTGVQDKDSTRQSTSHDVCLAQFNEAGYEVRWVTCSPHHNGVPQSRPRIHYLGICRHKLPNMAHRLAMDAMREEWCRLLRAVNFQIPLDDFLLLDWDLPTQPENHYRDRDDIVVPKEKSAGLPVKKFRWEEQHELFKKSNGVRPLIVGQIESTVIDQFLQFESKKMCCFPRFLGRYTSLVTVSHVVHCFPFWQCSVLIFLLKFLFYHFQVTLVPF